MVANIIDGKHIAATQRARLQAEVAARVAKGLRPPALAVIKLGHDPASEIYVRNKRKTCTDVGITSVAHDLSANATEQQLLHLIDQLNQNDQVDGILVQLPLPDHINSHRVLDRIAPQKDVDGFHPHNQGLLLQRRPMLRPCTPYGIMTLLAETGQPLEGQHAVIVGASNIVGRPMALELLLARATVTLCHSATKRLADHVQQADILIAAIGRRGIIQSDWIKPGAIVIDVGINRLDSGEICGDLDFDSAQARAGWITPVPGGVGPMTIATLLSNTLVAAALR